MRRIGRPKLLLLSAGALVIGVALLSTQSNRWSAQLIPSTRCASNVIDFSDFTYTGSSTTSQYLSKGVVITASSSNYALHTATWDIAGNFSGNVVGSPSLKADPTNFSAVGLWVPRANPGGTPAPSPSPGITIFFRNGSNQPSPVGASVSSPIVLYAKVLSQSAPGTYNAGTIASYDASNNLLQTFPLHNYQTHIVSGSAITYLTGQGQNIDSFIAAEKIQFTQGNVAKIVLTDTSQGTGVAFDDLSFQSATCNDAACISDTIPSLVAPGQPFDATINIQNNGNSTWTGGNYYLGYPSTGTNTTPAQWGISNAGASWPGWPSASITQGTTVPVAVHGTAPQTNGSYDFKWRMVLNGVGGEAFGGMCGKTITVRPLIDNASCGFGVLPTTVTAGQTFSVTMTATNNGETSWTSSNYSLIDLNTSPARWGVSTAAMQYSPIPPGQSAAFTFDVTAPSTPGTYPFQWKMAKGSTGFGQVCDSTITVNPLILSADFQIVSATGALTVARGEPYTVSITVKNNGPASVSGTLLNLTQIMGSRFAFQSADDGIVCDGQYPGHTPCKLPLMTSGETKEVRMNFVSVNAVNGTSVCNTTGDQHSIYFTMPQNTTDPVSSNNSLYLRNARITCAVCNDSADNDNDGRTDFPNDPGCVDANDETETNTTDLTPVLTADSTVSTDANGIFHIHPAVNNSGSQQADAASVEVTVTGTNLSTGTMQYGSQGCVVVSGRTNVFSCSVGRIAASSVSTYRPELFLKFATPPACGSDITVQAKTILENPAVTVDNNAANDLLSIVVPVAACPTSSASSVASSIPPSSSSESSTPSSSSVSSQSQSSSSQASVASQSSSRSSVSTSSSIPSYCCISGRCQQSTNCTQTFDQCLAVCLQSSSSSLRMIIDPSYQSFSFPAITIIQQQRSESTVVSSAPPSLPPPSSFSSLPQVVEAPTYAEIEMSVSSSSVCSVKICEEGGEKACNAIGLSCVPVNSHSCFVCITKTQQSSAPSFAAPSSAVTLTVSSKAQSSQFSSAPSTMVLSPFVEYPAAPLQPVCGNGVLEVGETCDRGTQNSNASGASCRTNCTLAKCGDEIVDAPFEQCDMGSRNTDSPNSLCSTKCTKPALKDTLTASIFDLPVSITGGQPQQQNIQQPQYPTILNPLMAAAPQHAPVGATGPGSLLAMAAGAATGVSYVRRKRTRS